MLQGTLDEFPLIDVLGILKARNKTGRLDIERQAGRGLIYVRLGEPYYAESSLTRSLIGQKLVDIGAITDMQLRKALDRQAESGDRLGQILLTHGVISREHIASAVISQIKDSLADLLAWETGEFRWELGAEVEVEVPVYGGILDATEGSAPLAPHVVPVSPAQSNPAPAPTQKDEPPRPEPEAQPQLEVLHSPASNDGGAEGEVRHVPFGQAASHQQHEAADTESESLEAADPEPETYKEQPTAGDGDFEDSSEPVAESPDHETGDGESAEPDRLGEEPHDHEATDRSDDGFEYHESAEPAEDDHLENESVEDDHAENESVESESTDDELTDDESRAEGASEEQEGDGDVEEINPFAEGLDLPPAEVVESHDGTRVMKAPAPQLDEEFDHMFQAVQAAVPDLDHDPELDPAADDEPGDTEPASPSSPQATDVDAAEAQIEDSSADEETAESPKPDSEIKLDRSSLVRELSNLLR